MADESSWQKWVSNGRASGVAWLIVLFIDVGLKVAKIPAPEIDQLLIALTGLFVGNITISRTKQDKSAGDDK